MNSSEPETVDEYIARAPKQTQDYARKVRAIIKKAAPEAMERISYQMPYYHQNGRVIYWGAWNEHIALYVMSASRLKYAEQIKPYHKSKSTLHFKLNEPLPEDLIAGLVKAQVKANLDN